MQTIFLFFFSALLLNRPLDKRKIDDRMHFRGFEAQETCCGITDMSWLNTPVDDGSRCALVQL